MTQLMQDWGHKERRGIRILCTNAFLCRQVSFIDEAYVKIVCNIYTLIAVVHYHCFAGSKTVALCLFSN